MASLLIFRRKLINFLCLVTLVFCTLSSYSQDIAQPSLDIDGNGKYDALTDGLLVLRNMFGLEGEALVNGALAPDAIYTSALASRRVSKTLVLFLILMATVKMML